MGVAPHTIRGGSGSAVDRGTCAQPRPAHLSRPAAPQFPPLHRRPDRLAGRHLDAERGAELAGLPPDPLGTSARDRLVLRPDRGVRAGTSGRDRGRPLLPPEGGHRDTNPVDVAGLRAGGAHPLRPRAGLARARARRPAGRDQCLRHARPAGAGDPDDQQGRSDQRHLAQFGGLQRGARGGAGRRRTAAGGGRRRHLFPDQRRQLSGRDSSA